MSDIETPSEAVNAPAPAPAPRPAPRPTEPAIVVAPAEPVAEPVVDGSDSESDVFERKTEVSEGSVIVYARQNNGVELADGTSLQPGVEYVAGTPTDPEDTRTYLPLELARQLVVDRVCDEKA